MKKIRIFSYDRAAGGYSFADYNCTVVLHDGQEPESGGTYRKNGGSVRIMTSKDVDVRPGDWLSLDTGRDRPDKDRDRLVTEVRDNRRGGLPHWRLILDGRAGVRVNS